MNLLQKKCTGLLFLLFAGFPLLAQTPSDVILGVQGRTGYELTGDYNQWDIGALYTQSSGASLRVLYGLSESINVYGGAGLHTFLIEDPASSAQLTQKLHLDYQLGAKVSLAFLFADVGWRFNPVNGDLNIQQGSRTYEHENTYQFHEFPARVGARFHFNQFTVGGGMYQYFVTGNQTRDVYRVLSDTTREFIEAQESGFSEQTPIGLFGLVNYQFSDDVGFGLEAIYRDQENFIIRLHYLKIQL